MTDRAQDVQAPDRRAQALKEGIELFNAGEFLAAHEAFEEGWLAAEGSRSRLLKGLLQASVCLYHLSRSNLKGAGSLYRGQRRLLGPLVHQTEQADIAALLDDMEGFVLPRLADGEASDCEAAGWPRIHLGTERTE